MPQEKTEQSKVRNRAGYSEADVRRFMVWSATPSMERNPHTQGAYSEQTGISEDTLARWKKRASFESERQELIKANMGDVLHDVVYAFKAEASKGSFPHQKMYFEMLNMYVEKREEKHTGSFVVDIGSDGDSTGPDTPTTAR